MFLELAEILDCPDCREAFGLVAFVDRAEDRRVLEGRLGCPLCEIEVPIRSGAMRFDLAGVDETSPDRDGPASMGADPDGSGSQSAMRIGALLGVGEGAGMAALLGPGLAGSAGPLAALSDRLEVLIWLDPGERVAPTIEELADGVNPVRGASHERWPVRSGALAGVALRGSVEAMLPEAERCTRSAGRLVVLEPAPGERDLLARSGFEELASDASAWVGERH